MILLIGYFLKTMKIHLSYSFDKSYYSIMHLTTYDVLTLVEIYGMFEMFISILHLAPNFHSDERVHFICSGRQRRMLLTRKLNAHYVLWQTIVSYFKYRMLTKKVILVVSVVSICILKHFAWVI